MTALRALATPLLIPVASKVYPNPVNQDSKITKSIIPYLDLIPDDISFYTIFLHNYLIGTLFHEGAVAHKVGEKLINNQTPVSITYKEHVSVAFHAQHRGGQRPNFSEGTKVPFL